MTDKTDKTGGPVFPAPIAVGPAGDVYYSGGGMTLLDHFAGLAMQGLISAHTADGGWAGNYPDKTPVEAYKMAAAMLRARQAYLEGEQ